MQMGPSHDPVSWTSGVWPLRILITRRPDPSSLRGRGNAAFTTARSTTRGIPLRLTKPEPICANQPFLLVFCTRRIVTIPARKGTVLVARDTQVFQHIARCAPRSYLRGGQQFTLGPFLLLLPEASFGRPAHF